MQFSACTTFLPEYLLQRHVRPVEGLLSHVHVQSRSVFQARDDLDILAMVH